jgi:HSP20 family protein
MEALQKRIDTLFNLQPSRATGGKETALTAARWAPLVDITEDEKEYLIKAELPEVQKGDVKVTVENGVLTISGERKLEKEEPNRKYHRVERAYGSFVRSFTVPEDTDDAKVTADFRDGVLSVRLIKQETARPKTIEVKVA